MNANVFVDTNVLVYAMDAGDPFKQRIAQRWRDDLWRRRNGRISYQVLQEFYANVTRKWAGTQRHVREEILDLLSWQPIVVDFVIIDVAWRIQDRYRLSFWDALIVAAAKSASCRYLLTEDLQSGQKIDGVTVVNPFVFGPEQILGS